MKTTANEPNTESPLNAEIMPEGYNQYDLSFKIIVLGDSGVGKSCLTMKGIKNTYQSDTYPTVGFEFFTFSVKIGGKIVKLQVWDTCGQEVYKSLVANFYRNSSLAIMVYAIDNKGSFDDISLWLEELKTNSNPKMKMFLVGNKSDLDMRREVLKEEAERYKTQHNFDLFMETSAKVGNSSQDIFLEAAKLLLKDYELYIDDNRSNFSGQWGSRKDSGQQVGSLGKKSNGSSKVALYQPSQMNPYPSNDRLPNKGSFNLKRDKDEDKSKSCKC